MPYLRIDLFICSGQFFTNPICTIFNFHIKFCVSQVKEGRNIFDMSYCICTCQAFCFRCASFTGYAAPVIFNAMFYGFNFLFGVIEISLIFFPLQLHRACDVLYAKSDLLSRHNHEVKQQSQQFQDRR